MKTTTTNTAKVGKANNTSKSVRKHLSAPITRQTQTNGAPRPTREQLEEAAYFNYINEGCPNDRALQHWRDAEALTSRTLTSHLDLAAH